MNEFPSVFLLFLPESVKLNERSISLTDSRLQHNSPKTIKPYYLFILIFWHDG